ncbi:MAG: hypothetical protein ACP5UC_02985 [Candidatus Micrarchaeia archaeon]
MRGFFGMRAPPLDLDIDAARAYLLSSFNALTAPTVKSCEKKADLLFRSLEDFSRALEKFSEIDAMPDVEVSGASNPSFVKSQKLNYQNVLANALASIKDSLGKIDKDTGYERMREVHSIYSSFIYKVLYTNSNFKVVVFGYYFGISLFKKPFSALERQAKELERELGKEGEHFGKYNSMRIAIEKLTMRIDELEALALPASASDSTHKGERNILISEAESHEHALKSLAEQLHVLESKLRLQRSEVEVILKPMERAARKFDHGLKEGSKIMPYISAPFEANFSGGQYSSFEDVLLKLRESVEKGEPDQEKKLLLQHINKAIDYSISQKITGINHLLGQISLIKLEIKKQESALEGYRSAAKEAEEEDRKQIDLGKRRELLSLEISRSKAEIEQMLYSEYGRQVRIKNLQ